MTFLFPVFRCYLIKFWALLWGRGAIYTHSSIKQTHFEWETNDEI